MAAIVPEPSAFPGPGPARSLPPLCLDHVLRLGDDTGLLQHALGAVPNYREGYCTDDNARAFLLAVQLGADGAVLDRLATRCLAFLAAALDPERGRFRNFMGFDRTWLEAEGSEDSHGRALWALGAGAAAAGDPGHRWLCARLFRAGLAVVPGFSSPRAWAFTLLGLEAFLDAFPGQPEAEGLRAELARRLLRLWRDHAGAAWPWFEDSVTYDNPRLCQALLLTGRRLPDPEALDAGLRSLDWLVAVQAAPAGHFRPVGNRGFHTRGGAPAPFDQQPLEAQAMVSACLEAHRATRDPAWLRTAWRAFDWFLGGNDLALPVYDARTGGSGDGLERDGVSANQGAESTLAFQLARAELAAYGSTSPAAP